MKVFWKGKSKCDVFYSSSIELYSSLYPNGYNFQKYNEAFLLFICSAVYYLYAFFPVNSRSPGPNEKEADTTAGWWRCPWTLKSTSGSSFITDISCTKPTLRCSVFCLWPPTWASHTGDMFMTAHISSDRCTVNWDRNLKPLGPMGKGVQTLGCQTRVQSNCVSVIMLTEGSDQIISMLLFYFYHIIQNSVAT
jgi:hypothetical protein